MVYKNCETFLNEEVRKPIMDDLKSVDNDIFTSVMETVDYLCQKYREISGAAIFYEKKTKYTPELFKEYMNFMIENGYLNEVDYDNLEETK